MIWMLPLLFRNAGTVSMSGVGLHLMARFALRRLWQVRTHTEGYSKRGKRFKFAGGPLARPLPKLELLYRYGGENQDWTYTERLQRMFDRNPRLDGVWFQRPPGVFSLIL